MNTERRKIMYEQFLDQIGDFIFVSDIPEESDMIFIPGNRYPQMAENAARLFKEGYAPYILPSGKYSVTKGRFSGIASKEEEYKGDFKTEWEFLKSVLLKNGVPEHVVLKEDQATFTYENAVYSRKVTDENGISVKKAILCCKTHHARRCKMYYQRLYPETKFFVCPSCADGITKENWNQTKEGIEAVTGEITRIISQFSLMIPK